MPLSSNSSLNLVDLDFANLKNSFKNFLKSQEEYKDYDFDGSNLSVLLELMARNTFHNAFYTNMAISEGFLDSAQLRNSIYSHAKELNYLPRSKRSAKATVEVTFNATGENQPYIIPKGSQFSTMIKSESYTFTVPETLTVASANTTFNFRTDLYEGVYLKDSYLYRDGVENQRFKITNKNVDTNSINVVVFEDGSEVGETYNLTSTLLDLNYKSKVFFLQTSETGYYEVYFGDGVLGYEPKKNSSIVIDYRISNGPLGNGAKQFSIDFDPTARGELTATPFVEVIEAGQNGALEESLESIRYYAPKHFQIQERTVNSSDYEVALKKQFPEINAISAFGGEELDPPQMARVVISIDINNAEGLPDSKVQEYTKFLEKRSPFGIKPIFIEPEYTYIQVRSGIRYNLNITTNSAARIKTLVTNEILNYNQVNLNDFNTVLRNSNFTTMIDKADNSIISNITTNRIYKKLRNPSTTEMKDYQIDFGVELVQSYGLSYPHSETELHIIQSSPFIYNGETVSINDDGAGHLLITKTLTDGTHLKIKDIGSVNYKTGRIELENFVPNGYSGQSIKFYAVPKDKDIRTTKNNIILIESDEIILNIEGING